MIQNASPTFWFVETKKKRKRTEYFGRKFFLLDYWFGMMWLDFNSRRCICVRIPCLIVLSSPLEDSNLKSLQKKIPGYLPYFMVLQNLWAIICIHIYIYIMNLWDVQYNNTIWTNIRMLSRPHKLPGGNKRGPSNHQLRLHGVSICDSKATHKLRLDADLYQKTQRKLGW